MLEFVTAIKLLQDYNIWPEPFFHDPAIIADLCRRADVITAQLHASDIRAITSTDWEQMLHAKVYLTYAAQGPHSTASLT